MELPVPEPVSLADLEAALPRIQQSPADRGTVDLIVRRPEVDMREVLTRGILSPAAGLEGDSWATRDSSRTADGSPHPEMQLTLMSSRVIALLTRDWALAGDQFFVDLDLSVANLPAGTRLRLGAAIVEVTPEPHTGCAKFAARFGRDALRFINSGTGRALRLRGLNARVVEAGVVNQGDSVHKLSG